MIEKYKWYQFTEVLDILKKLYIDGGDKGLWNNRGWCLYAKDGKVILESLCYVDDYPDIDDDTDEETYSSTVKKNQLEIKSRDEMLQDVVSSALYHKKNATNEELLKAFHFYNEKDNFLDL